jgi:hypothetical protein
MKLVLAQIIHIGMNNPPPGLRLGPTFAGHRSGLALSRPWERPVETYTCGPGRTCRRIIDENTPLVNNAG